MKDERLLRSQKQERTGMAKRGGVTNPRSGARWDRKNDGRTKNTLVEFKRTDRQQITIRFKDLRDLETHALAEGRTFELGFQLGGRNYVILSEEDHLSKHGEQLPTRFPSTGDVSGGEAGVVQESQMSRGLLREGRQPVLRGTSPKRQDPVGEDVLQGDAPRLPRTLSGATVLPELGTGDRAKVRRVGGNFRKRTPKTPSDEKQR